MANACKPRRADINFENTVKRADLVIIGQRTDYSPDEVKQYYGQAEGPESVKVRVLRVLKGTPDSKVITVNAWDGMCTDGIVADDKTYLMVLKKRVNMHDTVEHGCAFRTAPVNGQHVEIDAKQFSLNELKEKIN